MRLTQNYVDRLTLPPGKKDMLIFDSDIPGFCCRMQGERKSYVMRCRVGSKQRGMVIAAATAITLAEARKIASRLHAEIGLGGDPQGEKQASRIEPPALTFEAALKPFLAAKKAKLRPRTYSELQRHLCVPSKSLHKLPLASVGRAEIAAMRSKLDAAAGPCAANGWRTSVSSFFGWAAREGLIETNPVINTNKSVECGARTCVLTGTNCATFGTRSARATTLTFCDC